MKFELVKQIVPNIIRRIPNKSLNVEFHLIKIFLK